MADVGFVLRQGANQAEKVRRVAASPLSDAIAANSERATRMRSLVAVNESEAEAVVDGANVQSRLLSRELELGS